MATLKPFAELLIPATATAQSLSFEVSDDWLQGRSVFGGLQAALALVAMRRLSGVSAPLRVLQTTFIGPVPGGTVTVSATLLRAGKSVTHVEARITKGSETLALFVGVFGAARASHIAVAMPAQPAPQTGPEGLKDLPFLPGIAPNCMQHYGMRWASGGWPFSAAISSTSSIWIKSRDAAPSTTDFGQHAAELALIALTDAPPSPAVSMLKTVAPASSLTWTLELLAPATGDGNPAVGTAHDYWRIDSEIHQAKDGYVAQTALLYTPDNRVVALSRQSVVVFG